MKINKYAAIDIGSNAVRMLIANVIDRDGKRYFQKNALVRVPIRLGEDSFTSGEISSKKINRMVKSMKAFKHLMKVHGVKDYRAYATSALREANNGQVVIENVYRKSGIKIEIIDGRKEAKIISNAKAFNTLNMDKTYLYVDVGGGSTEFSILENGERIVSKSFKIGTVRLLNNLVSDKVWQEVKAWIEKHTEHFSKIYILGTGGNINKLYKMAGIKEGKPISFLTLNAIYEKLSKMSYEERIVNLELNPDRSDVILPATQIYLKALRWSGAKVIYVPQMGLSDGMIRAMVKKHPISRE